MNRLFIFLCLLAQSLYGQKQTEKVKWVNPFIGTGGHGHTFPGPTMPFGACQLSPDTRLEGWDGCSGYHYSDSIIYGFSHTHLSGTGCSDYGDILLMPVTKFMRLDNYQYASSFSHANEKAHAGYYEVFLNEPKVNVKLTTTLHGGVHLYEYPKDADMYVVLDLKHRDEVIESKMEQIDDYTIRGYRFSKAWAKNQKVFYEIKFSTSIESIQYETPKGGSETTSIDPQRAYQCIIKFKGSSKKPNPALASYLAVKCAISGVDEEGAHKNLIAEMPHWDFEKYQKECEAQWDKELSKIDIQDEKVSEDQRVIFYTALYHCMIHPSIYNDVDGRYRGRDDKIYNTQGKFDYYTVFSLWDTYRTLHPLLTIIDKKRTNDFINTFIKQYEQVGRLPIWELSSNETNCMIGYHAVSVIWDAYNKGIRDYDVQKAYEAMTAIATHTSHYEGAGLSMKLKEAYRASAADADALESYCKYGYVRSDDSHESVSKTLEYAYDDWCIAQMAKALGKTKDYEYYLNRSNNWMNVFDPTTGFMRARKNGCLYEPFSPYMVDNNYTEANSWQYSFYVPHDIKNFINAHGSPNKFIKLLDSLYNAKTETEGREQADISGLFGQYAHGNEPSHNLIYLHQLFSNHPQNTEILKKKIMNEFYKNEPDGLIGNEDCGQMSAWYVMNALGIYPFCPGDNIYLTSKPLFNSYSILTEKGMTKFEHQDLPVKKYLNYMGLNIKKQDELHKTAMTDGYPSLESGKYITHAELTKFDKVLFSTTDEVRKTAIHLDKKYDNKNVKAKAPFIIAGKRTFKSSLLLDINKLDDDDIMISINGSDYRKYTKPFTIKENTILHFYAKNTKEYIQTATFTKLPVDRKVILKSTYNKSYSAGGPDAMIDGIYGKLNWRAGDWQGYQGQDVEITIEFNQPRSITYLAANFLEDQNSWIFYPKRVVFYVSKDGKNWTEVRNIETKKSDKELQVTITKFETPFREFKPQKYRYAKVLAQNFGSMPAWHEGRGNPTFIFIDEFEVR